MDRRKPVNRASMGNPCCWRVRELSVRYRSWDVEAGTCGRRVCGSACVFRSERSTILAAFEIVSRPH